MFKKKSIVIALSCVMTLGVCGCGGKKVENDDKRPSIYVSLFNGGYGREWLDTIVKDYNESRPDNKYKISVRSSKDEFTQVLATVQSGTAVYDMVYTNSYAYKLINGNYLEEISAVWDKKPDGSDRTVREMMVGAEDYAKAYGDGKGGVYAVPLQESIRSFIYDHELFLQCGLLFNEDGEFISSATETLSKGKDGIAGTYDDGHPKTEEQWEAMVVKATQVLGYAFNYTGKFGMYTNSIYEAVSAQYDGMDKYLLNYTMDGKYDFGDGEQTISVENAYELVNMKGKQVAMNFMEKYLACKDATLGIKNTYTYPNSSGLSYSHTDAQADFITFTARKKSPKIGMIVEGDWWENESRGLFDELEEARYSDYAFKKHDYRFMTLPIFEGQKETGNVYHVGENMYLCLLKQKDEEKKSICLDFMNFSYQPKYIQNFTVVSGGVMPYDVELTEEQKATLSPFTKNFLAIYTDREHNKFLNNALYDNIYDTARAGIVSTAANGEHYMILNGLYYYSATDYLTKMYNNRVNNWENNKLAYEEYLKAKK